MSEPTVTVVVKRIRSLQNEESKILEPAKNKINELLSKIENLTSYLLHENNNRQLMKTSNENEDAKDKFIYKVTSENGESCSFLRSFLVERAHECEDVIDDIIYKIANQRKRKCSILKRYACKSYFHIDPQHIQKLEGIIKRLDKVKSDLEEPYDLKLKEKSTAQQLRSWDKPQKQPPPTSYPNNLVGLKNDINSLLEKLTRKGNQESVLYIVGTGGSGKTTLATELINHQVIKEHFKSVVWASASQKKDPQSIFLEILKKIQGKEEDASRSTTTKELVYKISKILEQKPHMIIMDDVEDPDNLATHMFPMIQHLNHQSKIIITTCIIPRNPYKHEEYAVSPDEKVDSLAKTLTKKKIHEASIFYMPARQATILLLSGLYEDNERLQQHFDLRTWVIIDENLDEKSILLKILQEIKRDTRIQKESAIDALNEQLEVVLAKKDIKRDTRIQKESTIDALVEQLEVVLAKKSSLIVLDQVQETKGLVGHLHRMLKNTNHRSKVIFMTNNPPEHLQENEEHITGVELLDADLLTTRLIGEGEQPILFSIKDLSNSGCNTDLARRLYNHQTVQQHFEHKFWITIRKEWNAAAALHQIIGHIGIDDTSKKDSNTKKLAELLLGALERKRYLLVLEDMGDAEDLIFDLFAVQKRDSAPNSKIVITVGNPRTLRHSNLKCLLYEMRPLTKEESWTLLCNIVVNRAKTRANIDQLIGQFNSNSKDGMTKRDALLKNCNGIPLAIVALGGLLSTKETVDEWETVSTYLGKQMQSDQALEGILLFCYHDLPRDINPCFLYFSLFPQQSEIPTGMLIRMWLAEGLVTLNTSSDTQQPLENVAAQYLEELACRCFIQVIKRNHIGEMKNIFLHNKIHQLSVKKSAELGFLENYPCTQNTDTPLLQAATHSRDNVPNIREMLLRRTTIHPGKFNAYPTKSSKLRTLVQFGRHGLSTEHYYFQHEAWILKLEPIHEHFKLLRVLILCGIRNCDTLPEKIGDLIFLTYLGLRATSIQALPETIQNLHKLITLDYRGSLKPSICKPLPDVILQMTELRHLYLPEKAIPSIKKLNLSTLKNLQILWGVSGGNWLTTDLAKLSAPLVKLGIVNIACNEELEAVVKWLNKGPKQLQVLKLDWHREGQVKPLFPDNLNSLQHLWKLTLVGRLKEGYNFKVLPSLVKLELFFSHLKRYDPTEMLGHLPHLKNMLLWNSYEGIQWICGANMFPKLEELQISHLPSLEEWRVAEGAMPGLKKLSIYSCWKLLGLPKGLKYLNLQELEILNMPMSFCSRLQETENENAAVGEDVDIIRNIRYIKFEAC